MFGNEDTRARARTRSARAKARYRGCQSHPTSTLDERYTADQFAFLKALDAWRRRTLATAPDAQGLAEIMQALDYAGGEVNDDRLTAKVREWREREGRRFPPATALFGLATGSFGFRRKEARP